MLFLMENAHCATAGDIEQNGAKHFTVARRAIVTCFRRVMIVYAGICKGKLKIATYFAHQKSFAVFFCGATKHVTISSFPLQMPAKLIETRLKHVTNARRAARKCQISLSHKPGTVETVRFPRKMLLEQGWTCEKMPLSWKMHRTHHEQMPHFAVKHAWDHKRDRRADCSWARLVNPEVKASDVFLFGLHPKDLSGGLRGLQTGSESITHAFAWSSPNLNPETRRFGCQVRDCTLQVFLFEVT